MLGNCCGKHGMWIFAMAVVLLADSIHYGRGLVLVFCLLVFCWWFINWDYWIVEHHTRNPSGLPYIK